MVSGAATVWREGDWTTVNATVHDVRASTTRLESFCISQKILDREGVDSYFAAFKHFHAGKDEEEGQRSVHLGPIDSEVYKVLRVYLTTGCVLFLYRDALEYAADVYLMERLRAKLNLVRGA